MQGLRLHLLKPHVAGPFVDAFGTILDPLSDHYWMVSHGEPFQHPEKLWAASGYDEEREEFTAGPLLRFKNLWVWREGEFELWGPGLFPEFASSVPDDWSTWVALREKPPDPRAWVASFWSDRIGLIERTADACILNVDNAYWSIYLRDAAVLDLLRASLNRRQYSVSPEDSRNGP